MELNTQFFLKNITLSILILFSAQNTAASVSDAIEATVDGNASEAVKLWTELANTGNSIAQYNLANHYTTGNGVQKNQQTADKWLKNATHSGLIQAYLNLNKKAIAPANGITISFNVDPTNWLTKQDSDKYTIQLASSRNEALIKKSYEENYLKDKGGYYHYVSDGVARYALIYGTYTTVADANAAIKDLPKNLSKQTPWVRKIESLQNISQ